MPKYICQYSACREVLSGNANHTIRRHLAKHGIRTTKCERCWKRYSRPDALTRHRGTCSGRPHPAYKKSHLPPTPKHSILDPYTLLECIPEEYLARAKEEAAHLKLEIPSKDDPKVDFEAKAFLWDEQRIPKSRKVTKKTRASTTAAVKKVVKSVVAEEQPVAGPSTRTRAAQQPKPVVVVKKEKKEKPVPAPSTRSSPRKKKTVVREESDDEYVPGDTSMKNRKNGKKPARYISPTPSPTVSDDEEEQDASTPSVSPPPLKAGRGKGPSTRLASPTPSVSDDDQDDEDYAPAPRASSRDQKQKATNEDEDDEDYVPTPRASSRGQKRKVIEEEEDDDVSDDASIETRPIVKKARLSPPPFPRPAPPELPLTGLRHAPSNDSNIQTTYQTEPSSTGASSPTEDLVSSTLDDSEVVTLQEDASLENLVFQYPASEDYPYIEPIATDLESQYRYLCASRTPIPPTGRTVLLSNAEIAEVIQQEVGRNYLEYDEYDVVYDQYGLPGFRLNF